MGSSKREAGFAAIVAATLVLPGLAGAQAVDGQRSITVTGSGEAWGKPDQAQVSAGVQTRAATVAEASRENQAVVDRMMDALEDQGIEARDIRTANYNIWPEQNHGDPRQGDGSVRITGYRVSNIVTVTVRDIEKVGQVIAAVTEAGANSVHGVQFTVEDSAGLEERAREAAITDARARAESLAELAGVELGDVLQISMTNGGGWPRPMMARMEAADAATVPGISPGEQSVNVQVQVSFAIR